MTANFKVYLTKKNRVTTDFILFEADDKFVRKAWGKVGKSGIGNSTLNAGSAEDTIPEIEKQTAELISKGFVISDLPESLVTMDAVFDKAKWHVNDEFPSDLDQYQSYVLTGLYVAWIIDSDFFEQDFKNENQKAINQHLTRQTTPVKFYEEQLDGVFDAEGLTQEAIKFTSHYFDLEKGQYVDDYLLIFDPDNNLPSMFHVADCWENYETLKPVLDKQFAEWKRTK
jgi:hypothetical protein